MSRATPVMRELAERLVAFEMEVADAPELEAPAAFVICEKLRPYLSMLMGKAGFCALLSRALALATAEAPALRTVRVRDDGSLAGGEESGTTAGLQHVSGGSVIMLAQLLGLLEAFVGRNLTLRMLLDLWPELPLHALEFNNDDPNEKA